MPKLSKLQQTRHISNDISLPLNVLNLLDIDNINELQAAGVNRFSLANSVFDDVVAYL